jgi:putative flavoprotein involved in K+ transport
VHRRGVTDVAGLYFLGLPWLHTWGSGRFSGVGLDAQLLADHIVAQRELNASAVGAAGG